MFFKKQIILPVEVSARHCHLSNEDLGKLFGQGHELQKLRQLSQPEEFACQETINILFGLSAQAGNKKIEKVRVVGPTRSQTQVEISLTDAVASGVTPPIRLSGNLKDSEKVIMIGPAGQVELQEGLIVAQRHIHCSPEDAKKYKLKNGQIVSVKIKSGRSVIFENVIVRLKEGFKFGMHIDTDEGNSAGIDKIGSGTIL